MRAYLDTSAAAKLLVEEAESAALASRLDDDAVTPVASFLVETELRRLAVRLELPQAAVTAILDGVDLYDLPPGVFREAGLLPGRSLRSLDALHLAAAIRLETDVLVTYDARLAATAGDVGLTALAPGR